MGWNVRQGLGEKKADGQARRQEQGMVILRSRGMEARQAEGERQAEREKCWGGWSGKELINKQQPHRK